MQVTGAMPGLGLCPEHFEQIRFAPSDDAGRILFEGWVRDYSPQAALPLQSGDATQATIPPEASTMSETTNPRPPNTPRPEDEPKETVPPLEGAEAPDEGEDEEKDEPGAPA